MTQFHLIIAEGFGINTNILETNIINLSVVIGIVVYFGGGFLTSLLTTRREAIVESLQDAEKRYAEAVERVEVAERRLQEAQEKAQTIRSQGERTATERAAQLRDALREDIERLGTNANSLLSSEKAKIIEQVCSQVVDLSLVRARAEMTNQSFLTTKQHTRVNEEMIERLPQPQLV